MARISRYATAPVCLSSGQQPQRELAVILLIHYRTAESEEHVKLAWVNDLTGLATSALCSCVATAACKPMGCPCWKPARLCNVCG